LLGCFIIDTITPPTIGEDGERTAPPGGRAHVTLPKNVVAPRVVKATAAAAAMVRPRAGGVKKKEELRRNKKAVKALKAAAE